jgi:hypothetical protein
LSDGITGGGSLENVENCDDVEGIDDERVLEVSELTIPDALVLTECWMVP